MSDTGPTPPAREPEAHEPEAHEPEAHEVVEQWRQEFAQEEAGALRWVPLADAERAAGVARSTLRAWFRSGDLPSRVEPGPHGPQRIVPLEAVLDKARRSPARRRARRKDTKADAQADRQADPQANPQAKWPESFSKLVETLTARAEARAAAAESELRVALERAAAAEAELRVLHERNLRQ